MSPESQARFVDLNADLGESYGLYRFGVDEELMGVITSANVACGFHGGDSRTMRESVDLAVERNVRVGAHVGLHDLLGFGRREMAINPQDAYDYTLHQIGALSGFVNTRGARLTHVKPHGALYMMACRDAALADAVVRATIDFSPDLSIYALPDSALARSGAASGLEVLPEFFADRPYEKGRVKMFGVTAEAVGSPRDVEDRLTNLLSTEAGAYIRTVCVHTDTPGAVALMTAVRRAVLKAGCHLGVDPESESTGALVTER